MTFMAQTIYFPAQKASVLFYKTSVASQNPASYLLLCVLHQCIVSQTFSPVFVPLIQLKCSEYSFIWDVERDGEACLSSDLKSSRRASMSNAWSKICSRVRILHSNESFFCHIFKPIRRISCSFIVFNVDWNWTLSISSVSSQLVGGQFDLEMNFIIQELESIGCMVELLDKCEPTCQAEVWSIFTAILKKSVRNLQACTEVGLIQQVLDRISTTDSMIAGVLGEERHWHRPEIPPLLSLLWPMLGMQTGADAQPRPPLLPQSASHLQISAN